MKIKMCLTKITLKVALLKFIENNGECLRRKVVDGNSKDVVFSKRLEALKVLPSKKIEQIAS